jgi:hypothetical protein
MHVRGLIPPSFKQTTNEKDEEHVEKEQQMKRR